MPRRLDHEERLGLRRLLSHARKERLSTRGNPHSDGLLHGSAMPWPPTVYRRPREIALPTLDDYDHVPLDLR